jgi:hypothetical protein
MAGCHAAALSSLSAPRATIFSASSGSGRCSALARSNGARNDIGQTSSFDEEKKDEVLDLLVRGYVERDGGLFNITARGEKVLSDRGAGPNES